MMKRLEQVAALVVAAGLALVSYWLFFSWAQGGGAHRRQKPQSSSASPLPWLWHAPNASKASAGLEQPLLGGTVVQGRDVGFHLVDSDLKASLGTKVNDSAKGTTGILQGLTEEGLGELGVLTDLGVERGGVSSGHRGASSPPEVIAS
jgi:hypothetical protein